jgi:lambda family phage portal protein
MTWVDMQNMALASASQDGEYIFRKYTTGKYGYQLQCIDPELLDVEKNTNTKNGEIRLGVEYNKVGQVVRYHFRKRERQGTYNAGTVSGETYAISATEILHGFISEWPDQSRGIPWMHAGLETAKHLEKYQESAIVNARSSASVTAYLKSQTGDEYTGSEDGTGEYDDATIDQFDTGTIKDIGDRDIVSVDPNYPHQMYADFVKSHLQNLSSGWGLSYHSLSNNLEGVNYSSIRAGVLEDREIFKGLQNWFVRGFVQPVYEDWILHAWAKQAILIGNTPLSSKRHASEYQQAHYQGRRWAWVDPQKDGTANQLAIDSRLKSRSQIMREQGDDPESVWREIARDDQKMAELGIAPIASTPPEKEPEDE